MKMSSKNIRKVDVLTLLVIVGALSSIGPALGQDTLGESVIVGDFASADKEGTVGWIEPGRFVVIISDSEYQLAPVVRYKGTNWSRERLINQLAAGQRLTYEVANPKSPQPQTIISMSEPNR
jgi:hypothetical protein